MAKVFLPGCKIKAAYPQESEALRAYIERHCGAETLGCCRVEHLQFDENSDVVYACNNCKAILDGSAPAARAISVWEIIDADPDFDFPDYGGVRMALRDCWIANDNAPVQDAVRSLCAKMNIEVVELDDNREKSTFCGANILVEPSASNVKLAPQRWSGEQADAAIHPLPPEEHEAQKRADCANIEGDEAICYCKFCADGLTLGGKTPHHMLQLLFS